MSTNQIQRLRMTLRHNHTDPSWLHDKTNERRKTADQLIGLDRNGCDSPPPGPPPRTSYDRDFIMAPKLWTAADGRVSDSRSRSRKSTFTEERSSSRPPTIHGVISTDAHGRTHDAQSTDVEKENMMLKRQIELLIAINNSSEIKKESYQQFENMLLKRQIEWLNSAGQHKLPPLHLSKIPRPPSGNSGSSANNFFTEPPATDRPQQHRLLGGGRSVAKGRPARRCGSQTDRPGEHLHPGTNEHSFGVHEHTSNRREPERVSGLHHSERTPVAAALQHEVDILKMQQKITQENVWSLEECLSAKDAELQIKEAEVNHLRFLIGVKEGNEAQALRESLFWQGKHSEDFVVNPEDNMAELGKFTLRRIDADIMRFTDDLKEYEDHVRAGDQEAYQGQRLLTAIDDERARRKGKFAAQFGGNDSAYRGLGGERLQKGCAECNRMILVADAEVDCHLLDNYMEEEEDSPLPSSQEEKKKKKKKMVRRIVGVEPPYDVLVKDPERWFKEKDTRKAMLNAKKVLDQATKIITDQIIHYMESEGLEIAGKTLGTDLYEIFLSQFGIRSLADFYLLELIEGLKMFFNHNPRIKFLAKAMRLRFAGSHLEDDHVHFYLEVWRELSTFLGESKDVKPIAKNQNEKTKKNVPAPSKVNSDSPCPVACLKQIQIKQEHDAPIVVKRIIVWKAIRRAMRTVFDHSWMPAEYSTPEEIFKDSLHISEEPVRFDDALTYAVTEMEKVNEQRREFLRQAFLDHDEDKSGKLDYTEFKKLIEKIDPDTPHKEVSSIFREVHMRIVLMLCMSAKLCVRCASLF